MRFPSQYDLEFQLTQDGNAFQDTQAVSVYESYQTPAQEDRRSNETDHATQQRRKYPKRYSPQETASTERG